MRRIRALSKRPLPFAEINRAIGEAAESLGEARPSYEQVRRLVHAFRYDAELPTLGSVVVDWGFHAKPARALVHELLEISNPDPRTQKLRKRVR